MKKITSNLLMLAMGIFLFMSCQHEDNKIPPCYNGRLDAGEMEIDCGGVCPPCAETCFDGIQNQGEQGVDCGGPCPICPTCNDGIMNGEETGVDCGGPSCPPCAASCDDQLLNGEEDGVDCGGLCDPCNPTVVDFAATVDGNPMVDPTTNATIAVGVLNITGSGAGLQISLTMAADIDPGSYVIPDDGVSATLNNAAANPPLFTGTGGVIVITAHDKVAKTISGSFSFVGENTDMETVEVTDGSFNISY